MYFRLDLEQSFGSFTLQSTRNGPQIKHNLWGRKRPNPIMFAQVINTCSVEEGLMRCHSGIQCDLFHWGFGGFPWTGDWGWCRLVWWRTPPKRSTFKEPMCAVLQPRLKYKLCQCFFFFSFLVIILLLTTESLFRMSAWVWYWRSCTVVFWHLTSLSNGLALYWREEKRSEAAARIYFCF